MNNNDYIFHWPRYNLKQEGKTQIVEIPYL